MPARSAFGTAGVDRLVVPRQLRLVGTASRPTSWSTRRKTHGSTRPSLRRTQRTGRMPAAPQRLPAHSHPWRPADPDLDRLCLFWPCGGAHTRSTTALGPSRGRAHDARRRAGLCGSFCRSFLRRPDCMVYRVTGANSAGTAVPRHIPVHGIPGATWFGFARAIFEELGADPRRCVRPQLRSHVRRPAQRIPSCR